MELKRKKLYQAPKAEVILLVPRESIAGWTVGKGDGWWNETFWWGAPVEGASVVTGTVGLFDEDGNEWTLPGP